jgi:predicted GNAT family N-acyltransferase
VKAVLEDVAEKNPESKLIYLHAQVQAIPFYAGLGFEAVGDEFTEADIRHRKMIFTGK